MFEDAAFESAAFEALWDSATGTSFDWSGEATMEFAATSAFVTLVESGQGLMSFSAEIHLRSL